MISVIPRPNVPTTSQLPVETAAIELQDIDFDHDINISSASKLRAAEANAAHGIHGHALSKEEELFLKETRSHVNLCRRSSPEAKHRNWRLESRAKSSGINAPRVRGKNMSACMRLHAISQVRHTNVWIL